MWIAASAVSSYRLAVALPASPGSDDVDPLSDWHLPGQTTHGHGQIELKCQACHDRGGGVREQSCHDCHGAALKAGRDTHPKKKFDDPSNAHMLTILDARSCLACHQEHAAERTAAMGVSVPGDFCWQCHENVAEDRPSHEGMAFDSCANVGCHNCHDNSALYENFLAKHLDEPAMREQPRRPVRGLIARGPLSLTAAEHDGPDGSPAEHVDAWAASGHALGGVNCSGCHQRAGDGTAAAWSDRVPTAVCGSCHAENVDGWHDGLHGMRPASGLSPMRPAWATLAMRPEAADVELDCNVCHSAHRAETTFAAADACLQCHADTHSRAWESTAHAALWRDEPAHGGPLAGTGVSCATCHLPAGENGKVEHNQNATLEPREKMVRRVCLNCHGLGFTLDALADPGGVDQCYGQPPPATVDSLQMIADWVSRRRR